MGGEPEVVRYRAAGGVVIADGMVLLLRVPKRGEVRLPKGHIEDGETPEEAALREVREETGYAGLKVVSNLGSLVNKFVHHGTEIVRHETYYLMRLDHTQAEPAKRETERQFAVEWVPASEAALRLTFESEREFVLRALACEGGVPGNE